MTTYYLTSASSTTSEKLPDQFDPPGFRIHRSFANEVVDSQLDGFFRGYALETIYKWWACLQVIFTYNQLWTKTTIKADEPFVMENFPNAVKAVLIQQLTYDSTALVLHPGLGI